MPATTKKPIKIVPNTIKTIPKVPLSPISKSKSFQEKLNDIQNNIDINIDDIPEDLLDIWDELQEDITPKLISKNYKLWLTIFTPFILPGIINGMSGKPAVPQPVVTVQEPAPDPKQIVNFAQKYFAEHGLELCKSLTKTDLNSMKQDLINNWGKGPDAFSKTFQDSYPVSKSRLENIYRSERHLAEYNGVLERAKIAGHKYKQWRAVGDERSCDLCMSHDMETVPINESFSNGEMTATGHPQCRCSMVTYSDEDYNEMKEDSAYLDDVVNTIKLNYNCPDSEKVGTGPGSCGGSVDKESKPSSNDIWLSKIGKLPEDEPGYFYHTTTKDVLDSIKSRGLVGNQKEHNFSSNVNPNTQLTFLSASIEDKEETENNPRSVGVSYWSKMLFEKNKKDPVILRVKKENVSGVKEFGKGYEFRTKDKIDPKNLQYWSGNKWHDLSDLKKQDSAYLADAFETIKLNYKCPKGTVDDSNRCNIEDSDVPETRVFYEENIKSKILSLNDSKYPKDAVFRSKSRSNMTKNVELDVLNNNDHVKILSDNIDKLHYQCDNLKIPRLRGIVADKNTKAGLASMADGILAVTPDMFRNDPDSEVDLRLSRNQERLNYINNKINSLESFIQIDKEKWTKNNPSLVNSGMKFEESTFYKTGYFWPKEISEYKTEKNNIMARINDLNTKKTNALIYTWKPGMSDSEKPFGASEYFPFEQSPKLLLDHEFGHHIHQLYGVKNAKSYATPPLEKKIDQIYKKSEKDGTLIIPSKYAASDHQEWFAESYSLYVNGRDDLVTPGLIDLFKKIGVKHDN